MLNKIDSFMLRAIEISRISVSESGGPFGCVIVKNGIIIAEGRNKVTLDNDPTAHAEIVTIRNACKKLKTFNLKGLEIYTSCEPCPMCYIYSELSKDLNDRKIQLHQINQKDAIKAFQDWELKKDKIEY